MPVSAPVFRHTQQPSKRIPRSIKFGEEHMGISRLKILYKIFMTLCKFNRPRFEKCQIPLSEWGPLPNCDAHTNPEFKTSFSITLETIAKKLWRTPSNSKGTKSIVRSADHLSCFSWLLRFNRFKQQGDLTCLLGERRVHSFQTTPCLTTQYPLLCAL